MRITSVRETTVGIGGDISNAFIDFRSMTVSAVAIEFDVTRNGRRLVGYGFNSNGRYAAGGILRERTIPRLLAAEPTSLLDDAGTNFDPGRIWATVMANEKPGGHGERSSAVGALDMAAWDLVAKIADRPLSVLLAERAGLDPDPDVFVYAAGGYYEPGKGLDGLRDEIRSYLDQGYTTVKMKIGGAPLAEDLKRIDAVLGLLDGPSRLAVDANGRLDLSGALAYADALAPPGPALVRGAWRPARLRAQSSRGRAISRIGCDRREFFSLPDARNLIRYGGLRPEKDVLQFDPALSYGLVEYERIVAMLQEQGWSARRCIPHGGHLMTLHAAAGLHLGGNESYPKVFWPFGGFADNEPIEAGRICLPDVPGIGLELKGDLMTVLRDRFA